MKFVRMLILALGMVTLATAVGFASVPFNTTATVNMMNVDAQTGLIGAVLYTPMAAGFVQNGEIISLNLPTNVPISYLPDVSVSMTGSVGTVGFKEYWGAAPAGLTGFTQAPGGAFATTYGDTRTTSTSGATISNISVQVNQNNLIISFNSTINFATTDFIKIDGVRVDPTAMAVAGGSLQINLTNSIGQATTDTPQLFVAAFTDKIMQLTSVAGVGGASAPGLYFTSGGAAYNSGSGDRNLVTVTLKELFPNAWDTKVNTSFQTWANTKIKMALTIPPELPVTITGVTLAGPDGATFANGQLQGLAITTNPLKVGIVAQNANKLESVQIGIKFSVTSAGASTLPLTSPAITFTALLDPPPAVGLPYNAETYYGAQLKHRVAAAPVTGSIPVTIVPLSSNLLSIYNSVIRNNKGVMLYDTGLSITNLTGSNPSGAFPAGSPGTIVATMYPMDGSAPLTTDSTMLSAALKTQSGVNASGALPAKGTFVILLSQLLETAGFSATDSFRGFVRFKCNFQESVGVSVIGDPAFTNYTVGFPMVSDTPTSQNLNLSINIPSGGGAATGTITGTVVPPVF